MNKFGQIALSVQTAKAIHELGFSQPTPIQQQAIPLLMQASDLIGQAQTGTGKTLAFIVPILESVDPALAVVQALVLAPTRELAVQVAKEARQLAKHSHVKVLEVYGGAGIEPQINQLNKGVQVVVGTPGRVIDLYKRGALKLDCVKIAILDEADRMLDMGFIDDVDFILSKVQKERQTALFSATMPKPVMDLANKYMTSPEFIKVSEDKLTVEKIKQYYFGLDARDKINALCTILKTRGATQTVVFCRTKRGADNLEMFLRDRGFKALSLHGNLTQARRDRVMQQFRDGTIEVLVATDLAARGLDVENVSHVINYNLPEEPMQYVHRIGRTGRAGREGEAVSFATNLEEIRFLKTVAQHTNSEIEELKIEIQRTWKRGLLKDDFKNDKGRYRRGAERDNRGGRGGGPKRRFSKGGRGRSPSRHGGRFEGSGGQRQGSDRGGRPRRRFGGGFSMRNNPRRF